MVRVEPNQSNLLSLEEEQRDNSRKSQPISSNLRQKIIAISVGLLFLVMLGLLIHCFTRTHNKTCEDSNSGDIDDDIIVKSVELFSNDSVDPCDNFFHFACKDWHQENPRPVDHESEWNWQSPLSEKVFEIIAELMKNPAEEDDIPAFKQAQQFYNNCLKFQGEEIKESEGTALGLLWNIYEEYGGTQNHSSNPHEVDCAYFVQEIFKFAVGSKYLLKLHNASNLFLILDEVTLMSKNIKTSLNSLEKSSHEEGVDFEKMKNITICLGFPTWMLNKTRVQQVYDELTLNQSTFPEQFSQAVVWTLQRRLERVEGDEILNDDDLCNWDTFPGGTFAHFDPDRFQIYIPMGEIDQIFRSQGQSSASKYGSMGFTIGHELTHALYALGFKSYKNGSLTTTEKCFVKHYSGFTVNELRNESYFLDGKTTLEENFADVTGLHLAFNAFKQIMSTNLKEEQNFFLGFAHHFCEAYTLQGLKEAMHGNGHSPGMFRVLGTLQNSNEFAKTWNCPVGSNMNPWSSDNNKCSVF